MQSRFVLCFLAFLLLYSCSGKSAMPGKPKRQRDSTAVDSAAVDSNETNQSGSSGEAARWEYRNPVLRGFYPDPSVCKVGDDFYLATSSFEFFPGIPIFHSKDLVHWQQIGHCLSRESQLSLDSVPSSRGVYAPTLRHIDGRFYLISTCVQGGGHFYVSAVNPAGPWSDPVWLFDEGFDPSVFVDTGGTVYLSYTAIREQVIKQARIDLQAGTLLEEPYVIYAGSGGSYPEGPHIYKIGQWYYLLDAENGTFYNHAATIARGPSPKGPFEPFAGNPILCHRYHPTSPIQATGHADLVELDNGDWWAVFLGIRPQGGRFQHLGRETFLAPVNWTADGWLYIGDSGRVDLACTAPALPPVHWPAAPVRDHFDNETPGLQWNFIRNPAPQSWSLSERPGHMRLYGLASTLDSVGRVAFIGRRQTDLSCRFTAAVSFAPDRMHEAAGLALRAHERFHAAILMRINHEGRQCAVLRTTIAGRSVESAPLIVDTDRILMRITARPLDYSFMVSTDGGESWRTLGEEQTRSFSSERIWDSGGVNFTGVVAGMYATGAGQRSRAPADFDWFDYQRL